MTIGGFLIIDKPKGITSFDVIRRLRKITGIRKIGHAGTLDPLATGVLVLAFSKMTKRLKFLTGLDKEYEAEIKLGAISDTYDAEGKIEEKVKSQALPIGRQDLKVAGERDIKEVLKTFTGEIKQIPPKYSALKVNGRKACDVMRKGGDIDLKPRDVKIYKIMLLEFSWPILKIRVSCSSGTYIRSLAHDIGQKLGCGAYLNELRRTKVGEFTLDQAVELDDEKRIREEIEIEGGRRD